MLGQRRGHLPLRSARPKAKPCCRPRVAAFASFLAALWLLVMFNLRRLDAMKASVRAPPAPSSLSHTASPPPADDAPHYVLATFVNGATLGDGLRLLHSSDGYAWEALPGAPVLLPLAETGGRVFRDPSIVLHDGVFHLVWSSDLCVGQLPGKWQCREERGPHRPKPRFGYARSTNLLRWEGVRLIEVDLPDACSLWAPELSVLGAADGGGFSVTFSATQVAGACPKNFKKTAHRAWSVTSADMVSFSAPRRLLETEDESIIDLFPMLDAVAPGSGPRHALVYKAEKNDCKRREWTAGRPVRAADGCTLVLRLARAHNASGPWTPDRSVSGGFFPGALSRPCVEGPAPFRLPSGEWLVLVDAYRDDCTVFEPPPCDGTTVGGAEASAAAMRAGAADGAGADAPPRSCAFSPSRKGFGAIKSSGGALGRWVDVSAQVSAPEGYKHGTVVTIARSRWKEIRQSFSRVGTYSHFA